jgi:hypothetical protein
MLQEQELTAFVAELYQPTVGAEQGNQRVAGHEQRCSTGRSAKPRE